MSHAEFFLCTQVAMYKRRYPNFTGKVSLFCHSLGSVITFDILQNQVCSVCLLQISVLQSCSCVTLTLLLFSGSCLILCRTRCVYFLITEVLLTDFRASFSILHCSLFCYYLGSMITFDILQNQLCAVFLLQMSAIHSRCCVILLFCYHQGSIDTVVTSDILLM